MGYRLEQVDYAYPGRPIFSGLELELQAGRFHGVIGPNGCGKSTLLDLLGGLKRPLRGQVHWHDDNLAHQSPKALARRIALVPQDFRIDFPFTAEEVVMMGRYPHLMRFDAPSAADRDTVAAVMARTDTDAFRQRRITELSGGERQRVIFARALAQGTDVLLLDEATSAMDIHHSLRLLAIAAEGVMQDALTVVAVFQDINLAAQFCQRLIFLKGGRIVAQGDTDTVLIPATLASIFDVQAEVRENGFLGRHQVAYRLPEEGKDHG